MQYIAQVNYHLTIYFYVINSVVTYASQLPHHQNLALNVYVKKKSDILKLNDQNRRIKTK
jgi:hypothetical protein